VREGEVKRAQTPKGGAFTRVAAAMAIAFLPLRGWSTEPDWPQSLYLPGIKVTASAKTEPAPGKDDRKHELGRCDILLWVTADGYIRVSQVIKSTGHSRLDEACLRAVMGKKMTPADDNTGPIDRWAILPVTWELLLAKEPNPPDRILPSAPLAPNQSLRVTFSDFPKGAVQRKEHGDSWVHVDVSDSGQVLNVKIAESSGSSELDNAALDAIRVARFSPAFSDHKPVNSSADVVVSWVLPDSNPAGTSTTQP
jgi:TonB family protein